MHPYSQTRRRLELFSDLYALVYHEREPAEPARLHERSERPAQTVGHCHRSPAFCLFFPSSSGRMANPK